MMQIPPNADLFRDAFRQADAAAGRGGDTMVAHLTPGEMTIPPSVQQQLGPENMARLRAAFLAAGRNPERFLVGSRAQSVNPQTGLPEFYDGDGFSDGYAEGVTSSGGVAGPSTGYGMGSGPFGNTPDGKGGPGSETAASAAQAKAQNNPTVDPKSDTLGLYGTIATTLGMNPFKAAEDEANWSSTMANAFMSYMAPVNPALMNGVAQTVGYGINSGLNALGITPAEQGVQRGDTGHPGAETSGPTDPLFAAKPTDPTAPQPTPAPNPAWMPGKSVLPASVPDPTRQMFRQAFGLSS